MSHCLVVVVSLREGFNKLYSVSFMWTPMIGTLTTVIVGLIASLLSGNDLIGNNFRNLQW